MRWIGVSVTALAAALGLLAPRARADDSESIRAAVREEVRAYLEAEKQKADKEAKEKGTMKVAWKDGLTFESSDKSFKAALVGRVHLDYWTFAADEAFEAATGDEFDTAIFFRRARMGMDLTILKNTRAHFSYDFARGGGNQNGIADAYAALVNMKDCGGLPDVYAGHFLEPFGLEVPPDNYMTFIEYSLPTLTFAPFRNTGVMLQRGFLSTKPAKGDPFDRLLVYVGAFQANSNAWGDGIFSDEGASEFDGDQDGWAVTGRIVALPWVDCARPCRSVHVGLAGSWRTDLRTDNLRFRARPEVGIGPRTIDTGADIVADDVLLLGAEVAVVLDRFAAQGEYMLADVSAPTQGDPVYTGWYVQASYLLTGECKTYDRGRGMFGKVKPCRPLTCGDCAVRGPGAWEIGARFSTVDLNDGVLAVHGGEEWNATFGVNWYLNNNVRLMLNYLHAEIDDHPAGTDGTVDAFGVRVAAFW